MKLDQLSNKRSLRWYLALYITDEFTYDDVFNVVHQLGGDIVNSNCQPDECNVTIVYGNREELQKAKKTIRRLSRGKPRFKYGPGWMSA